MGLLDKFHGKAKDQNVLEPHVEEKNETQISSNSSTNPRQKSKDVIDMMVALSDMAMRDGDFARAVEIYHNILRLEPNETAQYNLGSLYAQGKGTEQNFMEGAYWFHQAELAGNEQAGKLCTKCSLDFTHKNFDGKSAEHLYTDMVRFIKYVYPEIVDFNLEVCRKLYAIAGNHLNKQEYVAAAKLFRAAAEFGNDGYSQNYLAVLYNAGAGLEKNDLASLYWFDKAVDNGAADVAQTDRDGMLNAYRTNFTPVEFYEEMMKLSGWCSVGSKDVPRDSAKAVYWRVTAESRAKEAAEKRA